MIDSCISYLVEKLSHQLDTFNGFDYHQMKLVVQAVEIRNLPIQIVLNQSLHTAIYAAHHTSTVIALTENIHE